MKPSAIWLSKHTFEKFIIRSNLNFSTLDLKIDFKKKDNYARNEMFKA